MKKLSSLKCASLQILKWVACLLLLSSCLKSTAHAEEANHQENDANPIYVSLGSHCEVTNFIGYNGLRTAAYPFDWMLTFNRSLISVLEQDFAFYVDETYLKSHRFGVVNRYYQIDFRHDWPDFGQNWHKMDIRRILPEVQDKYQRRIERFYELAQHKGKVFFIRAPLDIDYSLDVYPTFTKEAKRITSEEALAIRNLLLDKFPNLDFNLIIINYAEEGAPPIVGLEKVHEFRVRLSHKFEDWENILLSLN
ncbi:MAG: DUF1796 family putative cysteine peptidase [Chlamydiales bacterium]